MSKAILFGNRKGGTGKSTSAILLANYLSADHKVLLLDTDDQQSVVTAFGKKDVPFQIGAFPDDIENVKQKNEFLKMMEGWKEQFDYILIDQAGKLEISYKYEALMESADMIVVPVTPTNLAWEGTKSYLEFLLQRNKKVNITCFINMYHPNRRRSKQMKRELKALKQFGITTLMNPINHYEEIGELKLNTSDYKNENASLNIQNWAGELKRMVA